MVKGVHLLIRDARLSESDYHAARNAMTAWFGDIVNADAARLSARRAKRE